MLRSRILARRHALRQVPLDMSFACLRRPTSRRYERLLMDVVRGNQTRSCAAMK